jgi:hypothetical protein
MQFNTRSDLAASLAATLSTQAKGRREKIEAGAFMATLLGRGAKHVFDAVALHDRVAGAWTMQVHDDDPGRGSLK